jgi:enoyl-CoA hydratase/carnithine racemase
MSNEIIYKVEDSIAIIKFNRVENNNSFSIPMLKEWFYYLQDAEKDDNVKGLIITGNGKVFCSGGDIKDMVDGNLSGWKMKDFLTDNVHKIANYMENFPKPTLAAINGAAMGAGLDMALMCDFRIASEKAFFAETYIKLGLVAGDGGAYLLPRIIGLPRALEMLLTGEIVNPEKALQWGLINKIVEQDKLIEESKEYLFKVTKWPKEAVSLMKKLVYNSFKQSFKDHLREVSSHMGMLSSTDEYNELANNLYKNLLDKNKK